MKLRVLITNIGLFGRSGTEIFVRELAPALRSLGADVAVYSPRTGAIADELRDIGIPVVERLDDLAVAPYIVHGHHHVETVEALLHFPMARGIFVCHDAEVWYDRPPDSPRILRYVSVDHCVAERLESYSFAKERGIEIIPNAVDTSRYQLRAALPDRPARALLFSNYARRDHNFETLLAMTAERRIRLDVAGAGMGAESAAPERLLGGYDVVFAKARCALEAAATGAYVVLYHDGRLGPVLTSENAAECLRWNLGRRLFTEDLTAGGLRERLDGYSPREALAIAQTVRKRNSLDVLAPRWMALYHGVLTQDASIGSETDLSYYLSTLVKTVADYERRDRFDMLPLDQKAAAQIAIRLLQAPRRVEAGCEFALRVAVENRGSQRLLEAGPHPVRIAGRWLHGKRLRGKTVFEAARRGLLPWASEPESVNTYTMRQQAPEQPGRYVLRVALVQEGVFWLCDLPGGSAVDVKIEVTPRRVLSGA